MASKGIVAVMVIGIAIAVGLATQDVTAGGGCRSPEHTQARGTTVEMRQGCMSPTILQAREGETVTFRNADPMVHVVVGAHSSWGNYANIAPGDAVSYVFAKPGVYPYTCHLHPGMTGAIVVGDGATAMAGAQSKGEPLLAAMAVRAADEGATDAPAAALQEEEGGSTPWAAGAAGLAVGMAGAGGIAWVRRRA